MVIRIFAGPLMVITQKVTSLAYNIHDGLSRKECDSDLTENQKYYMVRKMPSALEYFSYVLHFQALMAGPILFYVDYINFIDGTNLLVPKPTASVSILNLYTQNVEVTLHNLGSLNKEKL